MNIASYQAAFGAADMTSSAMRAAIREWFELYYRDKPAGGEDPCQRIACTVVSKLVRTAFSEYTAHADTPFGQRVLQALDGVKATAVQLALVGGACCIKPWVMGDSFGFTLIPRDRLLIFARDAQGNPSDVGTAEHSTYGNAYYTLLERRTVDGGGYLTIKNRLYRSYNAQQLGTEVSLGSHPDYAGLQESYTFPEPLGLGLVGLKTPMLNCVDGSADGVSVYAPAVGLIHAIDRNEFLLAGEFERGQSRVFTSADLLDRDGALTDSLFVGLDEDVEHVGLTVFSPALREQSFLARKQEYLRNVESVIGLKRGLLSDANVEDRTATEIASSEGEHALTVLDFQRMWQQGAGEVLQLCAVLGRLYGIADAAGGKLSIDWGNGTLFDEDKLWEDYKDMVARGLLRPEIALGWRFGMDTGTEEALAAIRARLMPVS